MEERLMRVLEPLMIEGDPTHAIERLLQLVGEKPPSVNDEYSIARNKGLNISEAELAVTLAYALRVFSIDALVSRLEHSESPKHPRNLKRKRRTAREESEIKKKSKL